MIKSTCEQLSEFTEDQSRKPFNKVRGVWDRTRGDKITTAR